jgi:hypothetical protein
MSCRGGKSLGNSNNLAALAMVRDLQTASCELQEWPCIPMLSYYTRMACRTIHGRTDVEDGVFWTKERQGGG